MAPTAVGYPPAVQAGASPVPPGSPALPPRLLPARREARADTNVTVLPTRRDGRSDTNVTVLPTRREARAETNTTVLPVRRDTNVTRLSTGDTYTTGVSTPSRALATGASSPVPRGAF